jgi:hypothetical protein
MTVLAQRLALALLLAVSGASLGLSIHMVFTLRAVSAYLADNCTPGRGCNLPSWFDDGDESWWGEYRVCPADRRPDGGRTAQRDQQTLAATHILLHCIQRPHPRLPHLLVGRASAG